MLFQGYCFANVYPMFHWIGSQLAFAMLFFTSNSNLFLVVKSLLQDRALCQQRDFECSDRNVYYWKHTLLVYHNFPSRKHQKIWTQSNIFRHPDSKYFFHTSPYIILEIIIDLLVFNLAKYSRIQSKISSDFQKAFRTIHSGTICASRSSGISPPFLLSKSSLIFVDKGQLFFVDNPPSINFLNLTYSVLLFSWTKLNTSIINGNSNHMLHLLPDVLGVAITSNSSVSFRIIEEVLKFSTSLSFSLDAMV